MALILLDGFDKYGPANQTTPAVTSLLTAGDWTSAIIGTGSTHSIVAGLSAGGTALQFVSGGAGNVAAGVTRSFGTNYARLIGGVRLSQSGAESSQWGCGIQFLDGATAQCCITRNITTGTISLRNGDVSSATILATSSAVLALGTIHYIEWDITFGAAGNYQVWIDGVSAFSGTGNTKTTANSYANVLQLRGTSTTPSALSVFDDLYLFDSTGTTNNAPLLNNPLVETAFPNADAAKTWTVGAAVLGANNNAAGTTNAPGANQIFLRSFTARANMTLNSVSCVPAAASGTAKFKAVLYAGITAGSARIAEGSEVIGTASGSVLTAPFSVGQSLTSGTTYAVGLITDTSVALALSDTATTGARAANTYTSNSPATLPAMTASQSSWQIWGNCTSSDQDYVCLNINPPPDDSSYLYSSTVGQQEMQSFPALASNPASIAAVAYKARLKRSDTGARTVEVHCASGAADTAGNTAGGVTPGSSYAWTPIVLPTDPATGVAWTGTGVNAARAGVKVFA